MYFNANLVNSQKPFICWSEFYDSWSIASVNPLKYFTCLFNPHALRLMVSPFQFEIYAIVIIPNDNNGIIGKFKTSP